MKIFIAASKQFYDSVFAIREELEKVGHVVTPPNGFDDPHAEERAKRLSEEEYIQWKGKMIRGDSNIVAMHDAILILNFEKNGQKNYIGGATFLEMFKAFELGKKIFLYNPIPRGVFTDELVGLNPIVINGDLNNIV